MTRREHVITELAGQLLRAENPAVIEAVAIQLKAEIEQYVRDSKTPSATTTLISVPFESIRII